ncbi:GDSL esterase/lipase [Dichanthelium oligosanthes]|uniref:GDSL esterase/lipase n=1 Tax=Dichanthelium oligosanthes TaxID=888268 RepID=A0A1E5VUZ1_9POAL|nr:GDSL esterase/lipase [Dichanthelium oligosanthes]
MASSSAFLLLALSLLALHFCCCHGKGGGDDGNGVTAIYSLGDSITDTGNLVKEAPPGMFETIKHLPYGVTLGTPTGRCSDGLLMIDFLAEDLGLPFLNPYLGKNKSFDHGVNFAVAGATAMDPSDQFNLTVPMPFASNSLKVQLRWFKDFLKSSFDTDEGNSSLLFFFQLPTFLALNTDHSKPFRVSAEIRKKLQSSLVLVGEIGGNDYNYAFFENKAVAEVEKLIPGVIKTIIDAAKEVLAMGASRVIIPGNFPIGCVPGYLAMNAASSEPADYDSAGCLRELNHFAAKHNTRLQSAVSELQASHRNASVAYADYYNSFLTLLHNASSLGFDAASTRKACCGAGGGEYNFEWQRMCGFAGATACEEPSTYLSWDGIHMTQAAYRAMSRLIYHGKYLQPQILSFPEKYGQT